MFCAAVGMADTSEIEPAAMRMRITGACRVKLLRKYGVSPCFARQGWGDHGFGRRSARHAAGSTSCMALMLILSAPSALTFEARFKNIFDHEVAVRGLSRLVQAARPRLDLVQALRGE